MLVPNSISSKFFSDKHIKNKFTRILLLNLESWSDAPIVLTFVCDEYLIGKHFGDRGRINKCCKADITGDSIFQDAYFLLTLDLHSNQHNNSWEMFALQQIHNPSVHQQFPNFPVKAKKEKGEKKKRQKHFLCFENLNNHNSHSI